MQGLALRRSPSRDSDLQIGPFSFSNSDEAEGPWPVRSNKIAPFSHSFNWPLLINSDTFAFVIDIS